jgi:hypothetical protein
MWPDKTADLAQIVPLANQHHGSCAERHKPYGEIESVAAHMPGETKG